MALTPGTRLGPYEVTARIGAGGMGEVYRARDTTLGRDVAIKVLPEAFAHDPERLARFQREAHVLASLNHPSIAQIYGLEKSAGIHALVMELVEGPTLAYRIAQGAIPLDESLPIAKQIAEALGAAHEQGIIHRDLKPANINVRPDGTVKVLDFGLAKAMEPAGAASPSVSESPTITTPAMTQMGMILGTAAYMSPEQAAGKRVDKRADIWAFGCVLYEMLTGRRLFAGDDLTETIASVLKGQPDLSQVPPAVHRLLGRCLEKDPKRRLRDIGDAWELMGGSTADAVAEPAPVRRARLLWISTVAVSVALGALGVWFLKAAPIETRNVGRFAHVLSAGERFTNTGRPLVAVSRDGTRVAYVANLQIYVRDLDELDTRLVAGTNVTPTTPFFSPDGEWIGFYSRGQLMKIRITGGTPIPLCKAGNPFGVSWGADDQIVFGQVGGIMRVSGSGGTPEIVVESKAGEQVHGPGMLPDGRTILYAIASNTSATPWDEAQIVVQPVGGERKIVWKGGADARYVSTGHLVFGLRDTLFAVPFDLSRLATTGRAVPIVEGVLRSTFSQTGAANYGFSENGTLAYVPSTAGLEPRMLVWVDRQGREESVGVQPREYANPRVSPDGTQVAVTTRDAGADVWVWDVARRTLKQLTSDPLPNYTAAWFPDSKRLAFPAWVGTGDITREVHVQAADGSGRPQVLKKLTTEKDVYTFPVSISRDGRLVFTRDTGSDVDIGLLPLLDSAAGLTMLKSPGIDRNPAISPDGRWLAFESDRTGRFEIHVRPFPNFADGVQQVTTNGGTAPVWARDGRELYYWTESAGTVSIMAVPIVPGPTFNWGASAPVVRGRYAHPSFDTQYDVWAGRFLMLKTAVGGAEPRLEIVIVQHWFEELKRLVPTN